MRTDVLIEPVHLNASFIILGITYMCSQIYRTEPTNLKIKPNVNLVA
jgi:hypothetical protein